MLKCELRVRISFRPSPNAIMAGRGTLRRAPLFAFCRRRLQRQRGEWVCLTPWKLPGGLLWLSSSLGLSSTASHLGRRLRGCSEGQGSDDAGVSVSVWLEGSLSSCRPKDPKGCSNAGLTLCKVRAPMSIQKCQGCRGSDACPGSSVPPHRAPLAALPLASAHQYAQGAHAW